MNNFELIQSYFNTTGAQVDVTQFVFDLFLTAVLASLLGLIYVQFGNSLSNRKTFAANFVLLSLTTMLIITIVKSSLALSLGLVGALSIVRFRAAIKEPEELTYLFMAISLGLGFGAEQRYITVTAFVFISIILIVKSLIKKTSGFKSNLFLSIESKEKLDLKELTELIKKFSSNYSFKRLDETKDSSQYLFSANFKDINNLNSFKDKIRHVDQNAEIRFFEEKDIFY